ncbi:MAG: preprotein translocase subunit SecG [Desulfobacterota bacterium]|nr:preprotein translocase subunit SecG [Thermodesulfobacteriota bacterium]
MTILIVSVHIIVCLGLILIVLLQTGKGASMGAAFGGSSQTIFGSSGATTFLGKLTTGVAVVFMITSLLLAFLTGPRQKSSVMDAAPAPVQAPAKTAPAPAPTGAAPAAPTAPATPTGK